MTIRHEYTADSTKSLLLIIDFQQKMLRAIPSWEEIAGRVGQLTKSAEILEVPVVLTEQYSKGLGATLPEILEKIHPAPPVFHKEHFSACLEPAFLGMVRSFARPQLVVVGMETHVCVLQTCLDLLHAGFQVHLVADAVASRATINRDLALDLLRQAGALITSTEIVLFQWSCRANTDTFRRILPIVK